MYPCAQISSMIRGPCRVWVKCWCNAQKTNISPSLQSHFQAVITWALSAFTDQCLLICHVAQEPPGLWLWKASGSDTSASPFCHSNQVWGAKHCLIPSAPSLRPNSGLCRDSFVRSAQRATNCSTERDKILFSKEALVCSVMTLYVSYKCELNWKYVAFRTAETKSESFFFTN